MLTLQAAVEQIPLLKRSQTAAYQVNLACERLLAMGKYRGWVVPVHLQVYEDGTVTLPGDFETMLGATAGGAAQVLRDPWFEFVPRPNRSAEPDPRFYPADLGDNYVTYRSPHGAAKFRLVLSEPTLDFEAKVDLTIRRTEDQGIRAVVETFSATLGEGVEWLTDGPINAVLKFIKPRTEGYVSLEGLFGEEWRELGRFGPRDTEIRLRKYSIPAAKEGGSIVAFCKRRFRPVEELKDELPVESIYCLRMALEALLSETEGNLEKANNYWGLARQALSDALSEHRNSAVRTVPIYCRAAAGYKLRAIR